MHASENGTAIAGGANDTLLRSDCIGCHTKDNAGAAGVMTNDEPGIYKDSIALDATNTLAGGNFFYSDIGVGDSHYGHNPTELTGGAQALTPPGWKATGFPAGGVTADGGGDNWAGNDLSCAGVYGCHGKHTADELDGAHHTNVSDNVGLDGSTVGKSYRFLLGITGIEDENYEFQPAETLAVHNGYKAVARTTDATESTETISYFCAECHGMFHSGATTEGIDNADFTSPWIRHPVDVVLPAVAEFNAYVYTAEVPVGYDSVAALETGDEIVMCLSCHRAHASPYPYALRWDYTTIIAGGGDTGGCFKCHTEKD